MSKLFKRLVAILEDLVIRHLVPNGEAWLLMKTEPDFGHDGQ
jgi:hypothetical protein